MKIESLAKLLADISQGRINGKIKIVVGDGFYSQLGIKSRQIIISDAQSQGKIVDTDIEKDSTCWRVYEVYRWRSGNVLPPRRYFFLHHLVTLGLVNAIITTNYDLFLDSIFIKDKILQGHTLNPLINDVDCNWDEFYNKITDIATKLRLWKIHGSFSHSSFMKYSSSSCHIFKLPRFLVGYPMIDPSIEHGLPSHDHLGPVNHPCVEIASNSLDNCQCSRLAHFIDMNFARDRFNRVIDAAIVDLKASDTAAVVAIGFTGYFDSSSPGDTKNEEIVPHLIEISRRVPVYAILAPHQNPNDSHLYKMLDPYGNSMKGDLDSILRELLTSYYDLISRNGISKIQDLIRQFNINWKHGELFVTEPY
jgi:hypothetical protein